MLQNLSSAAVVIGALRVNTDSEYLKSEASSTVRALSGALCTCVTPLYTLQIKIDTEQRVPASSGIVEFASASTA